MASDASFVCPLCPRAFVSLGGSFAHVMAKHGIKAARRFWPDHPSIVRQNAREAADRERQRRQRDAEPSMADLVIRASLARTCGQPVDDDIAEMFDV